MKKSILTLIVALAFFSSKAQIIIDSGDMPSVNDTIRISSALPDPGIDISSTGPNQTWDYSSLVPVTQHIDTFLSVSSTGTAYAFFFIDNAFNVNRANLAFYEGDQPSGGGITITEAYSYYYKTNSFFKQVGVGAKINGIPTPVAYSPHDVIYNFPLNYSDQDTGNSGWSFNLPNVLFYSNEQTRINHADGWGSLTTPYGTFSALRMKSIRHVKDSIKMDTIPFPFVFNNIITEHKWLGKQQDLPLLKINTQTNFGVPVVTLVEYRDSARVLTNLQENALKPSGVNVYPNPFLDYVNVEYTLGQTARLNIEILDMQGRLVYRQELPQQPPGVYQYILGGKGTLTQGTYFLKLTTGKNAEVIRKLIYLE